VRADPEGAVVSRLDAEQRFAVIPEWVLYHPGLDARAVHLYGILARHSDRSGQAFPSRARLAVLLRCSRDTVDRTLQQLKEGGAVTWERRTDEAGDPTSNLYLLRVTPPAGDAPGVAASMPPPSRVHAATGSRVDAAGGGRADAALNESQGNGKPLELSRRDVLWESVEQVMERKPETRSERGRWNAAVKELRDAGATPEQVYQRAAEYRRRWPRVEFSPNALSAHWGSLATRPAGTVGRGLAAIDAIRHELEDDCGPPV